jgi:hypothetical protein
MTMTATERRPVNLFVLGLEARNRSLLNGLSHLPNYRVHPLLDKRTLMRRDSDPLPGLLDRAEQALAETGEQVDAIVGYWDFPVSSMVPVLCERHGLPGPSLESVLKCEHKYWSRLEQQRVCDEHPGFALVDLADPQPPPGLRFPMWLKPVKSRSSELAFRVTDRGQFDYAAARVGAGVDWIGNAFDDALSLLGSALPPEIAAAGGRACLAEEEVTGFELTVEGYVHRGRPQVYGVIDSIMYPGTSCFLRYQYPSSLPAHVVDWTIDVTDRVLRQIGLDDSTFNIEFFWDPDRDRLDIVEINPRISQSHAPLFAFVDGAPNHQALVSLALGREPELPYRQGKHEVAAKWFLRHFTDGYVRRAPTPDEVEQVERELPGTIVDVLAAQGTRLADVPMQDSYSFELAAFYMGARDEAELKDKYERAVELLPFEIDE